MSWLIKVNDSPFNYEIEGDSFYRANETHYRPVVKEYKDMLYVGYDGYVSVFRKNGEWIKNIEIGRGTNYNKSYVVRGMEFDEIDGKDIIIVCGNRFRYNYSQIFVRKYEIETGIFLTNYEPNKINHSYVQGIVKTTNGDFIIIGTIWDNNKISVDDGNTGNSDCPTTTISGDCQTEYDNAIRNNNLASFYNRCQTEGGSNPLRNRCALCCGNNVTTTSEEKKLHWQILFLKLNNNCNLKNNGIKTIGKVDWDYATSVTIDDENNLYVSASIWLDSNSGSIKLNDVSGKNVTVGNSENEIEIFAPSSYKYNVGIIYKINENGRVLWGKLLNDIANNQVIYGRKTIPTDVFYKNDYIYFCAYEYSVGVVFGKIDKYAPLHPEDPSSSIINKKVITNLSVTNYNTVLCNAYSINIDNNNNIYIGGYIKGKFNGKFNYGLHDFFIIKYNNNFVFQSVYQYGSNTSDSITDMIIDNDGFIYSTGFTKYIGFSIEPSNVDSNYYTTDTPTTEIFLNKNNTQFLGGSPSITSIDFTFGDIYSSQDKNENQQITINLANANGYILEVTIKNGNTEVSTNFTIVNNIQNIQIDASTSILQLGSGISLNVSDYNNDFLTVVSRILQTNNVSQKNFFVKTTVLIDSVSTSFGNYLNEIESTNNQDIIVESEVGITIILVLSHNNVILYTSDPTVSTQSTTELDLTPEILDSLPQGQIDYEIIATDIYGNTDIFNGFFIHDTKADITNIILNWGTYLNSIEDDNNQTVIIDTSGIEHGQTIELSLNNVMYYGTISGNTCVITLSSENLQLLPFGTNMIDISTSDIAGNYDFSSVNFIYDISADITSTIITNTQDNNGYLYITNNSFTITNTYDFIDQGTVVITFSGEDLNGNTIDISFTQNIINNEITNVFLNVNDMSNNNDYTITITATDEANNVSSVVQNVIYNQQIPDISNVYYQWKVIDLLNGNLSENIDGVLNAITDNDDQSIYIITKNVVNSKEAILYFPYDNDISNINFTTVIFDNSGTFTISKEYLELLDNGEIFYNITIENADDLNRNLSYNSSFDHDIIPEILNIRLYDELGINLDSKINKTNVSNGVTVRIYTDNIEYNNIIDISIAYINLQTNEVVNYIPNTTLSAEILDKSLFENINGITDNTAFYTNSYGICDFSLNYQFFSDFIISTKIEKYRILLSTQNDSGVKTNVVKDFFYDICAQILDDVLLSWSNQLVNFQDVSFNLSQTTTDQSITIFTNGIEDSKTVIYSIQDITNNINLLDNSSSLIFDNSSVLIFKKNVLENFSYDNSYQLIINATDILNNEASKIIQLNYINLEPRIISNIQVSWSIGSGVKGNINMRSFNLDEVELANMRIVTNVEVEFIIINTENVLNGTANVTMNNFTVYDFPVINNTVTIYLDPWKDSGLVDRTKYDIYISITNEYGLNINGETFLFYDPYYYERGTIGFMNIEKLCKKQCEVSTTKELYKSVTKKVNNSREIGKKYNKTVSGIAKIKSTNFNNTTATIIIDYLGVPEKIEGFLTSNYDNRNIIIYSNEIFLENLYPNTSYNFKVILYYTCDLLYESYIDFKTDKINSFVYPYQIQIINPTNKMFDSNTVNHTVNFQLSSDIELNTEILLNIINNENQNTIYYNINSYDFTIDLSINTNYSIQYSNFINNFEYSFEIDFNTLNEDVPRIQNWEYSNDYFEITYISNSINESFILNGNMINTEKTVISDLIYKVYLDLSINTDYSFCVVSSFETNNQYKSELVEFKTLNEANTQFVLFNETYNSEGNIDNINLVLSNETQKYDISYDIIIEKDLSNGSTSTLQYTYGYEDSIIINVNDFFVINDTYKLYVNTRFLRTSEQNVSFRNFVTKDVISTVKRKSKVKNVTLDIKNTSTLILFEDTSGNDVNVSYRVFNDLIETQDSTTSTESYVNIFIDVSYNEINNALFTGLIPETLYNSKIRSYYNGYPFFYYDYIDISYVTINEGATDIVINNKTNTSIEFNLSTKFNVSLYHVLTLTEINNISSNVKFIFDFSLNTTNNITLVDVSYTNILEDNYELNNNFLTNNEDDNLNLNYDIKIKNITENTNYNVLLESYYSNNELYITDASNVTITNPYYLVTKLRGDSISLQFKNGIVTYDITTNTFDTVTITHSTEKDSTGDEPTIIFDNNYEKIFTIDNLINNTKYYLTTYIGDVAVNVDIYQTKDEINASDINILITGYSIILSNAYTLNQYNGNILVKNVRYNVIIKDYNTDLIVRQFINIEIDTLDIGLNKNVLYAIEIYTIYNNFDLYGELINTNIYTINTDQLLGESYFVLKNEYISNVTITEIKNNSIQLIWDNIENDDISSNSFLLGSDVYSLDLANNSYNLSGLEIGKEYNITFITVYNSGNTYSTITNFTTLNENVLDIRLALQPSSVINNLDTNVVQTLFINTNKYTDISSHSITVESSSGNVISINQQNNIVSLIDSPNTLYNTNETYEITSFITTYNTGNQYGGDISYVYDISNNIRDDQDNIIYSILMSPNTVDRNFHFYVDHTSIDITWNSLDLQDQISYNIIFKSIKVDVNSQVIIEEVEKVENILSVLNFKQDNLEIDTSYNIEITVNIENDNFRTYEYSISTFNGSNIIGLRYNEDLDIVNDIGEREINKRIFFTNEKHDLVIYYEIKLFLEEDSSELYIKIEKESFLFDNNEYSYNINAYLKEGKSYVLTLKCVYEELLIDTKPQNVFYKNIYTSNLSINSGIYTPIINVGSESIRVIWNELTNDNRYTIILKNEFDNRLDSSEISSENIQNREYIFDGLVRGNIYKIEFFRYFIEGYYIVINYDFVSVDGEKIPINDFNSIIKYQYDNLITLKPNYYNKNNIILNSIIIRSLDNNETTTLNSLDSFIDLNFVLLGNIYEIYFITTYNYVNTNIFIEYNNVFTSDVIQVTVLNDDQNFSNIIDNGNFSEIDSSTNPNNWILDNCIVEDIQPTIVSSIQNMIRFNTSVQSQTFPNIQQNTIGNNLIDGIVGNYEISFLVRNDDSLAEYNSFFQLIIYKGDSVYFETGIFRNKSTEWSKIIIKTQILESFENLKLKITATKYTDNTFYITDISLKRVTTFLEDTKIYYLPNGNYEYTNDYTNVYLTKWDDLKYTTLYDNYEIPTIFSSTNISISFWIHVKDLRLETFSNIIDINDVLQVKLLKQFSIIDKPITVLFNFKTLFLLEPNISMFMNIDYERDTLITLTISGKIISIYKNNELYDTITSSYYLVEATNNSNITIHEVNNYIYNILRFRIIDRVLQQSEIVENYNYEKEFINFIENINISTKNYATDIGNPSPLTNTYRFVDNDITKINNYYSLSEINFNEYMDNNIIITNNTAVSFTLYKSRNYDTSETIRFITLGRNSDQLAGITSSFLFFGITKDDIFSIEQANIEDNSEPIVKRFDLKLRFNEYYHFIIYFNLNNSKIYVNGQYYSTIALNNLENPYRYIQIYEKNEINLKISNFFLNDFVSMNDSIGKSLYFNSISITLVYDENCNYMIELPNTDTYKNETYVINTNMYDLSLSYNDGVIFQSSAENNYQNFTGEISNNIIYILFGNNNSGRNLFNKGDQENIITLKIPNQNISYNISPLNAIMTNPPTITSSINESFTEIIYTLNITDSEIYNYTILRDNTYYSSGTISSDNNVIVNEITDNSNNFFNFISLEIESLKIKEVSTLSIPKLLLFGDTDSTVDNGGTITLTIEKPDNSFYENITTFYFELIGLTIDNINNASITGSFINVDSTLSKTFTVTTTENKEFFAKLLTPYQNVVSNTMFINDTSKPSLYSDKNIVNEGDSFSLFIKPSIRDNIGKRYNYEIIYNNNTDESENLNNLLNELNIASANGIFIIGFTEERKFTVNNDNITQGGRQIEFRLTDEDYTEVIHRILINDTSKSETYTLLCNKTTVVEGEDIEITLDTEGIIEDTVEYLIEGINKYDIESFKENNVDKEIELTGRISSTSILIFKITADNFTESTKTMTFSILSSEGNRLSFVVVTIEDTSVSPTYKVNISDRNLTFNTNYTIYIETNGSVPNGTVVPFTLDSEIDSISTFISTDLPYDTTIKKITGSFIIGYVTSYTFVTRRQLELNEINNNVIISNGSDYKNTVILEIDNRFSSNNSTDNVTLFKSRFNYTTTNYSIEIDVRTESVIFGDLIVFDVISFGIPIGVDIKYALTGIDSGDYNDITVNGERKNLEGTLTNMTGFIKKNTFIISTKIGLNENKILNIHAYALIDSSISDTKNVNVNITRIN